VTTVETPDGRIFSGVGVSEESLQETVDARNEPAEKTSETATPAAAAPADKPKRGQKRIDELTFQREEAQRERDAEKARADELAAKLDAALQAQQAIAPAPPAPQAPSPSSVAATSPQPSVPAAPAPAFSIANRPMPTIEQIGTKYQSYEDFNADVAQWKTEQTLLQLGITGPIDLDARIRQSLEADRASRTAVDAWPDLLSRGKAAYPDFEARMQASPGDYPVAMQQWLILNRPDAEHLFYRLATDRQWAQQVNAMWARDPGGFQVAFSAAPSSATPAGRAPTASQSAPVMSVPPPPMQPVGSGSKTTAKSLQDLAATGGEDYDTSGYREARAAARNGGKRR
jgi:hypothetical protein